MLKEIHLKNVGPPPNIDIVCASRLNILTGDNGLGKTFLLEYYLVVYFTKMGEKFNNSY
jgi:recombinational DNA repair ATPase RecF